MDLKRYQNTTSISALLFVSLLGSSMEPVLIKHFNFAISPLALISMKSLVGGLLIIPFAVHLRNLQRSSLPQLLLVSFLAFITNTFLFLSIERIPASTLITIITTTPAIVGLVNYKRGTVEINHKFIIGFAFVFIGMMLTLNSLVSETTDWTLGGIAFALMSVVTSTIYRVRIDDLTQTVNPLAISVSIFTLNGLASLILIPFLNIPRDSIPFGLWLGLTGVIANIAFLFAIKHLGSTRVSILSVIQRPMAIIMGTILLNEAVSSKQVVGMLFIFFGVLSATAKKKLKPNIWNKNEIFNN